MEIAICGKLALSPNHVFNPNPDILNGLYPIVQESSAVWHIPYARFIEESISFIGPSVVYKLDGDRNSVCKGLCSNFGASVVKSAATAGRGGGLLERPVIEKATPGRESEFDLRRSRKMTPPYRVILHNDDFNKREYVVQVLMKVIPAMTLDNAVNIMQEAHYNGLSLVIICAQADAEEHCMQLRGNGLLSSIEPASGGCC